MLKILGHHPLQAAAVKADELAQEVDGEQAALIGLAFFFDDDLGQNCAGDVLAALGVINAEFRAFFNHRGEVVEGDIAAGRRVIEAAVSVLLDGNGLVLVVHDVFPAW